MFIIKIPNKISRLFQIVPLMIDMLLYYTILTLLQVLYKTIQPYNLNETVPIRWSHDEVPHAHSSRNLVK